MTNQLHWLIESVSTTLDTQIWDKLNRKTKPPGSLGKLEHLAFQLARIQGTLTPTLQDPVVLVFAGDHGIAQSGLVNPYPPEVTYQMVMNFLQGGAAINALANVANMQVMVVDSGVNHPFESSLPMIHAKMGLGTADYRAERAMSLETCHLAIQKGAEVVSSIAEKGTNVIGFGEMGIGNTSSASLIVSTVCDIPLAECVGQGTGVVGDFLDQKRKTLQSAQEFHGLDSRKNADTILATFGGFEIAQMVGGMLEAAARHCLIMVDGFISTAAFLIAHKMQPQIKEYAIFTHRSAERGHTKVLSYLDVDPLLELEMRLGEGTGCAASYPLLQMSAAMMNDMASFESAGVSGKTDP
ncbi:MAG: nicotinate-nucleotide--dimethylbenzimidazole phosphoribosyltransferase [Bacteroidota bacterium]